MANQTSDNNKRIAKNTILLYFRTIFIMLITLYTSRVILKQLGVEDYGIYNVVGGVVTMFSVISASLSSSISRFITFELGKKDENRLQIIFSTSVNIQFFISLIILLLGECVGVWFLNSKMSIPTERLVAANWVLQCSLITFCINLISVPYNALIIAHERMSAFAYISILEAVFKLAICYMLTISSIDKLIAYAVLMAIVALLIRLMYGVYCSKNFIESHFKFVYDKDLFNEMTSFAGWSFFTNVAWIFNTQGVNLLMNIFFGVALNAARGIATQVEGAVMQFVNNFTTAINPQITKFYASGEKEQMFTLICRGSKFSLLLLLVFVVPIEFEAEYLLTLWLKTVPDNAVVFARLALIGVIVNIVGNTGYTACMATGNIKRYVLWVTGVGFLVFPLTWGAYAVGLPSEITYVVYIVVYIIIDFVRLWIMKGLIGFPIAVFVRDAIIPFLCTAIIGMICPLLINILFKPSLLRFLLTVCMSIISVGLAICFVGLTEHERKMTIGKIIAKLKTNK